MAMSTYMRQVNQLAEEYDKNLLATDPRLRGLVVVKGQHDGSSFVFPDAFAVKKEDERGPWYVVFTEHYGYHVFHAEDHDVFCYSDREGVDSAPF